ncbi:MATE family efflux transporter [Rubritalea spongiae]|uniref:Multidrug-efflux transporter n=1 Tax=Rubritalea spongiae TaxID=430797 RepID=A0ABW5E3N9_9BACT
MNLRETKSIFTLAVPLVIGQLGQMLLGVVDTIMVGKVGVLDLAALSFANSLWIVPFVFGIGVLTCVSIHTSSARGKGETAFARNVCRNGLYLGALIGLVMFLLSMLAFPFLDQLKQPPEVVARSEIYYLIIMLSLIPCIMSLALKNHADALDRPWPAFWIFMAGVGLNILLNAALIFGLWGFPELGLEGAGISTFVARIFIVIGMIWWFSKDRSLSDWIPEHWLKKPDWKEIASLLKLGFPAGLQTLAEVSTFAAAGLMIGVFGAEALAAHQIALQSSGMAFMIPLGISMALTVRMGETGNDTQRQRSIVTTGWVLTLISSCTTAAIFIFAGTTIANWFIDNSGIVSLAASLLIVSGVFQIVDGLQVASTGLLRGLHDTRTPANIAILSYWVVGIPSGYLYAHYFGLEARGIWWGLATGLGVASLFLSARVWKKTA